MTGGSLGRGGAAESRPNETWNPRPVYCQQDAIQPTLHEPVFVAARPFLAAWAVSVAPSCGLSVRVAPSSDLSVKVAPFSGWSAKVAPSSGLSVKVAPSCGWSVKVAPSCGWSVKVAPSCGWSVRVVPSCAAQCSASAPLAERLACTAWKGPGVGELLGGVW